MLKFIPPLHGMRAFAALGVLLFHWSAVYGVQPLLHQDILKFGPTWQFSFFIGFGWMGVPLFFVLSGYLLTKGLQQQPLTPARTLKFWGRRVLRIYPAVWLQVAVFAAIGSAVAGLPQIHPNANGISNALLFINLPPAMVPPINPVWWTLPIELCFYILLPLLILLSNKVHWLAITLAGIAITLGWRIAAITILNDPPYPRYLHILDALPGTLTPFIMGYAMAHLPPTGQRVRAALLALSLIAIYGLLYVINVNLDSYWQGGTLLVLWPTLLACATAIAVWAVAEGLKGWQWLGARPLVWLGEISFGIYLWHFQCLKVVQNLLPTASPSLPVAFLGLLLTILATIVLASISFYLIEKPLMRWRRSKPTNA